MTLIWWREYVRTGSNASFAELVQRHINLVYSVALRFTGNPADAKDLAQASSSFWQGKQRLRTDTVLAAWLYQTTRLSARQWLRSRARRQHHQQKASMQSPHRKSECRRALGIRAVSDLSISCCVIFRSQWGNRKNILKKSRNFSP